MLKNATFEDIPYLVDHRLALFQENNGKAGKSFSLEQIDIFKASYNEFLEKNFIEKKLFAWLIPLNGTCLSSGAISILDWPPALGEPRHKAALLHSLYTIPSQRRNGNATQILQAAISFANAAGIKWITLGPSEDGRGLYEKIGFKDVNQMRFAISSQ